MKDKPGDFREIACAECANGEALGFDFSMAFQPIVDIRKREVFAYEALARGLGGEPAGAVFEHVNESNLYRFDQTCRVKAIQLASRLNIPCLLSINFMPNAIYRPELCIRTTLAAAEQYQFPSDQLLFEFNEREEVVDANHILNIIEHYHSLNFKVALDDFGAGFSGLNLLADVTPDYIKLDMALIRGVDACRTRQVIISSIVTMCHELGVTVIAEGIETTGELKTLGELGIELMQGFLLARPAFEALPEIRYPD